MEYRVLAVGDVVGETGLSHLERTLRSVQKLKGIDFTVVNGENASGVGLTEDQAWRIYDAGADVVTLGNHTFGKMEIRHALEEQPWLLRPANFTARAPGQGWGIYDMNGVTVRVINLIGRCDLSWGADNPFTVADHILEQDTADLTLVDFHAEATSEKLALAYYLDGRVTAVVGTHTHVQTADEKVLPKGTGYITDLGMCGAEHSVLGVRSDLAIKRLRTHLPVRFENERENCILHGVVLEIDEKTGKTNKIIRHEIR